MLKKALALCALVGLLVLALAACANTPEKPPVKAPPYNTSFPVSMPPLRAGTHPNVVYFTTTYSDYTHFSGIISRYDTTTGQTAQVSKIPGATIEEAQLSRDGQWVLFVAFLTDHDELRLVRLDGQDLQTLLDAPPYAAIRSAQWSPDQRAIIFDELPPQAGPVITYLLDIPHHSLQTVLTPPDRSGALYYVPHKWLDATRVLMVRILNSYSPAQNVYLLDTSQGANQPLSNLQQLYTGTFKCGDFDTSDDAASLFVSSCTTTGSRSTTITAYPLKGGSPRAILQSSTLAAAQLGFLSPDSLLLLTSNELWTMRAGGTALTRVLAASDQSTRLSFNSFSQDAWSNVSRDGSLFAMPSIQMGVDTHGSSLAYGTFRDGILHPIASTYIGILGLGTDIFLAGWTTF
jgi:eukaryotic-like serine/threonine-protein kinase